MSIGSTQASTARMYGNAYEGMARATRQFNEASEEMAKGIVTPEAAAEQIEATVLAKANAVAMRTADQLIGSVLDVRV